MYKIVGSDQKEYGPVDAQQIEEWILQGRANAQTIARLEEGPWVPLASLPEFASALSNAPVSSLPPLETLATGPSIGAKIHPLAVAGLALSVFGFLQCCTPCIALLALILSSVAFFQIRTDPARYSGSGVALAGIITSIVGIIIFAILLSTGIIDELMKNLPKLDLR